MSDKPNKLPKYELYGDEMIPLPDDFQPPEGIQAIGYYDGNEDGTALTQIGECYILRPQPPQQEKTRVAVDRDGNIIRSPKV